MGFPSHVFFNANTHGYRAAILKKYSLWLLPFYMVVATYFYYEKVRSMMRTAIVSNLLNTFSVNPILSFSTDRNENKTFTALFCVIPVK